MEKRKESSAGRQYPSLMVTAKTERLTNFQGLSQGHRRTAAFVLCSTTLILLLSIIFAQPPPPPHGAGGMPLVQLLDSSIEQIQPQIKPGGRANTLAVHPNNNNFIFVASESGGLFRSENAGKTWTHVDSLPVFYTNAVAFAKNPKFVIVTATEDFSVSNRGGIWRSSDEGKTWTQVPSPSAPPGVGDRFSAFEISIASDTGAMYVATVFGVSIGDAEGGSWKHVDPFGAGDRHVFSVVALPKTAQGKNLVLAGGPAGIRRSTDGGTSWLKPKPAIIELSPDTIEDMHAFGRSPARNDQAYVVAPAKLDDTGQKLLKLSQNEWNAACKDKVCVYMVLYLTTDGGDTWQQKFVAPLNNCSPNGCCGGVGFVKAIGKDTAFDLYVSNRCYIFKLPHGAAKWQPFIINNDQTALNSFTPTALQTSEVGDTRDLAFNTKNEPILVASDNGLAKPPDAESNIWTFAGIGETGNVPSGYDALQIYELKGQWVGDISSYYPIYNLYFGTQDNQFWSSDSGWAAWGNEGGYIDGEYRVPTSNDSLITLSPNFKPESNVKLKGLSFKSGIDSWPNPLIGDPSGWPKIIWKDFHVQGVPSYEGEGDFFGGTIHILYKKGFAFTTNLGNTWAQYATIPFDLVDLPRLSRSDEGTPVLYQVTREGFDATTKVESHGLARIVKKKNANDASVSYPFMNNFGDFGAGPTMGCCQYRVFAADPRDVMHLIASDTTSGKMMETTNGGDDWTEIPGLTSLVTDGGQLYFSGKIFFSGTVTDHVDAAQASAISFDPEDPNMVAVGTVQNGIFVSNNRGSIWQQVEGSKQATLISSLCWRSANELYVSTYGRGLWRVLIRYVIPCKDCVPCKPPDCWNKYTEQPPGELPSPYDHLALAYGGRIEGARVADRIVEELFVQPGTTIVFAADSRQVPKIKVTETTRPIGFQGVTRMPRPPDGARIVTGLTLKSKREKSELVGFQFSRGPRSMYVTEKKPEAQEKPVGRIEPPNARKPYLEVLTGSVTGPGSTIRLAGRNLEPGKPVEIAIDGNTVKRVAADRTGKFSTAVQAPFRFGVHSLTLIDSASRKVLNGASISLRPQDTQRQR
jgi:BNR-Asp box repeat protein